RRRFLEGGPRRGALPGGGPRRRRVGFPGRAASQAGLEICRDELGVGAQGTPEGRAVRRSPWATSWLLLIPLLIGAALRFHQAWSYYGVYMPRADQEEGYYEAGIALSRYHV